MKKEILLSALFVPAGIFSIILFQEPSLKESMKRGKEVYALNCQNCHLQNGEGMEGVNPPVAKTNYLKDAKKNIDIILNGQSGEITVNGKKYNALMPAQNYLTDQQIADVLNYIRNTWGNKYPVITPAQVKAERSKPAKNN